MWPRLVALCLAQGLGDAVPCVGPRHNNPEQFVNIASPPFCRIEDVTVPTAVWSRGEDWVTSTAETQRLLPHITNLVHHEHLPGWSHRDHIWSLDAPQRMCRQMVALTEKNP